MPANDILLPTISYGFHDFRTCLGGVYQKHTQQYSINPCDTPSGLVLKAINCFEENTCVHVVFNKRDYMYLYTCMSYRNL